MEWNVLFFFLNENIIAEQAADSIGGKTDPLIHANGSATLLLKLERKAHVHAPSRVED